MMGDNAKSKNFKTVGSPNEAQTSEHANVTNHKQL